MAQRRRKTKTNLVAIASFMLLLWLVFTWTKVPSVRALPRATEQGATTANDHRTHRHRERGVPNVTQPGEHPASQSATNGNASSNVNRSIHVALGIPTDSDPSDDYLLDHDIYVVSYNPNKNVPNWVAWALDRSFLGHVRRKNDFRPDASLPSTFYHVTPQDYHDSGYDRGHLCPSADRDDSSANNSLTFLMTNVQPQLHELNAGPWEKLEEYERELAHQRDAELFIVAGGIFDTHYRSVGHGVAVPKANFKIIVALRQGQSASDVKSETKTIAVVMPNEAA